VRLKAGGGTWRDASLRSKQETEKKVKKGADRNADILNRNIGQQARHAPTEVPADEGTKRRTWEGYAEDYRALSEELIDLSRRQQEALAQIKALEAQLDLKEVDLKKVKTQRLKDLERLAAVSRTRDLLEKRAAAQMAKVAAAQARTAPRMVGGAIEPDGAVPALKAQTIFLGGQPSEAQAKGPRIEARASQPLGWLDRLWWRQTVKAAQGAHKERRLGDAQILFEAALLGRQTSVLWAQYGHVLREAGQYMAGELAYRSALDLQPDQAEWHFLSGFCLEMAGQYNDAVPHYEAALAGDPSLADRYDHLRDFRARVGG
jgi:tetratricopeptide (TPR) repeat protein